MSTLVFTYILCIYIYMYYIYVLYILCTLLKITLYISLNKLLVSGPLSEGFSNL